MDEAELQGELRLGTISKIAQGRRATTVGLFDRLQMGKDISEEVKPD